MMAATQSLVPLQPPAAVPEASQPKVKTDVMVEAVEVPLVEMVIPALVVLAELDRKVVMEVMVAPMLEQVVEVRVLPVHR